MILMATIYRMQGYSWVFKTSPDLCGACSGQGLEALEVSEPPQNEKPQGFGSCERLPEQDVLFFKTRNPPCFCPVWPKNGVGNGKKLNLRAHFPSHLPSLKVPTGRETLGLRKAFVSPNNGLHQRKPVAFLFLVFFGFLHQKTAKKTMISVFLWFFGLFGALQVHRRDSNRTRWLLEKPRKEWRFAAARKRTQKSALCTGSAYGGFQRKGSLYCCLYFQMCKNIIFILHSILVSSSF